MEIENTAPASESLPEQQSGDVSVDVVSDATVSMDRRSSSTRTIELPPFPPRASVLLHTDNPNQKLYWDRSHYSSPAAQRLVLTKSATLYVGNLNFSTRQMHLQRHFEQLGPVKNIIMGLDRMKKQPCGFCFVEYYDRWHAIQSVSLLSGTKLDGRVIRVELDAGFQPGRQYGRGVSGGQVRDDRRKEGNDRQASHKRSHYESPTPTLDGALPSARSQQQPMEEEDDDMPQAKRRKL